MKLTPEDLMKILAEIITPLQDEISSIKSAFTDLGKEMSETTMTKNEAKVLIIERSSEERDRLLRDRDSFRGETGKQGLPGTDGLRGDRGETGETGSHGLPGRDGKDGREGIDGLRGKDGSNGKDGRDGINGASGAAGIDGDAGINGINGKHGDDGINGIDGKHGVDGYIGKDGSDGSDGSDGINGNAGKDGIGGRDGKDGLCGKDGKDGINGRDGKDGVIGTSGPRGDVGKKGTTGEKGERGLVGFMNAVEAWRDRPHDGGEIVTCGGATWHARRKTSNKPCHDSNSWELLSNGLWDIEWDDDTSLLIRTADGEERRSPVLKGDKGERGDSTSFVGDYSDTTIYRSSVDMVKCNGAAWIARKDGVLSKPGTAKGKDHWVCITHKGAKGDAGRDADEEIVKEKVLREFYADQQALIETTVKQVDAYFQGIDAR